MPPDDTTSSIITADRPTSISGSSSVILTERSPRRNFFATTYETPSKIAELVYPIAATLHPDRQGLLLGLMRPIPDIWRWNHSG